MCDWKSVTDMKQKSQGNLRCLTVAMAALDCREPLKKNRDLTMATLPTSTLDATGLGCDAVHQ
eukprot:m.227418 g.227418  ORF g.227418 m.227418 type:complete len:63 (-) comp17325_c0_seq1:2677-2865(-)